MLLALWRGGGVQFPEKSIMKHFSLIVSAYNIIYEKKVLPYHYECDQSAEGWWAFHGIQHLHFLVLSYVYHKRPVLGLKHEWFRELSFSRLECGVHDRLHIIHHCVGSLKP